MLACGEREAMVMAPPPRHDSAVLPCFHGCLAFLHRYFPTTISFLTSPRPYSSLCSQQQPSPWDCCIIPKLQLPATASSRGPAALSRVCMAVARTVRFSFRLGCYRSPVSLSALKCFSSDSEMALMWGSDPCFSPPTSQRQIQS